MTYFNALAGGDLLRISG